MHDCPYTCPGMTRHLKEAQPGTDVLRGLASFTLVPHILPRIMVSERPRLRLGTGEGVISRSREHRRTMIAWLKPRYRSARAPIATRERRLRSCGSYQGYVRESLQISIVCQTEQSCRSPSDTGTRDRAAPLVQSLTSVHTNTQPHPTFGMWTEQSRV